MTCSNCGRRILSHQWFCTPIKALGHPQGLGGSILTYQCSQRCHGAVWREEKAWRERRCIERFFDRLARAEARPLERLVGL